MTISTIKKHIDSEYRSWFPFADFNQIQQQSIPTLLESNENVVISAPTGSGKTTLFELAMIRAFKTSRKKILYLSPMRALCTEKANLWKVKLQQIGKTCLELIGGDSTENSDIDEADLIISTPEKWDCITRSNCHLDQIGLILIDEVHILNDQRGAVLEAIISRMRLCLPPDSYRIVAVSATIPNISNLATWLRSAQTNQPAKILKFPDSLRPVPLKTHVVAVPMNNKNGFTFDFGLNYKIPEIVAKYSDNKPTLIFCSTRKSTIKTIEFLSTVAKNTVYEDSSIVLEDKKLQELVVKHSLAYHHAGLSASDRETIENLFRQSKIRILCSTSTLATGVNLPAHLVIIKSTLQYTESSGYSEYSDLDIRQMIGRAGRAGFDTHGIAVILTSTQTEHLYRTISEGKLEIDSQLLICFIEFLNTEISNGNIQSFSDAMKWLSYTFLHVRMTLNPSKYSLKPTESIQSQLENSMKLYLKELLTNGVIEYRNNGQIIQSTPLGQAMARNFIKFKSLKELLKSSFTQTTETAHLLKLVCQSPELLSQIAFKSGDKILLQKVAASDKLMFPIPGKVNWDAWKKPFLFIQLALQSELAEFEAKLTPSQRSDQQTCIDNAIRLIRFFVHVASQMNLALLLRNSLEFLSSLAGKSWHTNPKLLQQLPGIGQVSSHTLFNAGIRSIDALRSTEESRIEVLLKRNPPFGRNLKKKLAEEFPSVSFDCNLTDKVLSVKAESSSKIHAQVHILVIAYTKDSNSSARILLHHPTTTTSLHSQPFNKSIQISNESSSFSCSLMFEDWSGLNQNICFDISKDKSVDNVKEDVISEDVEFDTLDFSDLSELDIDNDTKSDSSCTHSIIPNVTVLSDRHLQQSHPNIPSPSISSSSSSQKLPSSCKHTCKDKLKCAHVCCKSGLLSQKRPLNNTENTENGVKINCLASSKRSLANAREYLRKYQPVNLTVPTSSLIPKVTATCENYTTTLYDEIEIALRSIE